MHAASPSATSPTILFVLFVFSIILLQSGTSVATQNVPNPKRDGSLRGSIILYNGKIRTMDLDDRVVTAVSIRNGEVVYAGDSEEDAMKGFSEPPLKVDLQGHLALPGLIDCHNHIVLMGNRPGHHTPLENAYSIGDVQDTYRSRAQSVPSGDFITTIGGFHPNQFQEKRLPDLKELDAAVPNTPAYISYGFFGPSVTNSAGRAFFEASSQAPMIAPDGSMAAGNETGKALLALRQQLSFADRKRSVVDSMAYAASLGVTTHLDQGAFQATNSPADGAAHEDNYAMHLPWLSVYGDGAGLVRLRINFLHMDKDLTVPTVTQRLLNTFKFFGSDMVRTGSIGEFITDNYTGGPVFEEAARRIARAGWRLEVHSLTNSDFQSQIQAFEKLDKEGSIKGLRWVVAHVPRITGEYLARLKALRGGVNLSGWMYLAGSGPNAGPPFRDIIASGIPAGIGADGMNIAPMNPWVHAFYATTGRNALGQLINDGQQISREDMLRLYTRANQWFLGGPDEQLLGAIEVGRLGDIVVLNDDYYKVSDDALKKLRSILTVVGGIVVHNSSELRAAR